MTSFPFLVPNLKPASAEHMERARQRRVLQAEAGLRKRLRHRPPKTGAEIRETGARETPAVETVGTERERRKNLRLLMVSLEHDNLLEDLSPQDLAMIEAMAAKLVRGELPTAKWRAVLFNLRSRRALRHPAPKVERKLEPPSGWRG